MIAEYYRKVNIKSLKKYHASKSSTKERCDGKVFGRPDFMGEEYCKGINIIR